MEDYGRRLPISTRQLRRIADNPQVQSEIGTTFMQDWGGRAKYEQMAHLPPEARVSYYAIQQGLSPDQIEVSTGLTKGEVQRGIARLKKEGLVEDTV
jgi:CRP-like cAMP-binding protein